MWRTAAIALLIVFTVLSVGFTAFVAYYFGIWPEPSLTVDDPAISAWLENPDVTIHRQGFKRQPDEPKMYLDQGRRVGKGCTFHTSLSLEGGETRKRVARTLATNSTTCERLVIEGFLR